MWSSEYSEHQRQFDQNQPIFIPILHTPPYICVALNHFK